ncbi:hypothetical protein SDC9_73754 [bioreactor metagenome]|uniref:Uncharacterized protein n=1 Tax=bioreactor metagenome TaxID=1076179 RepID=A0A644YMB1_9ZZZZ
MNNMEKVQKYIEKRIRETGIGILTLEELNGFLAEWMQIENSRPLEHFEGYSPSEMQLIMYNLFGENCPIQFADFVDKDCDSVPLFRQVKMLLEIIEKEENLKLTQTGNLPPRIVKEISSVGAIDPYIQSGIINLRTEKDSIFVQMARIAAQLMRATKKRGNSLSLTKNGKELLKNKRKLLSSILTVMFTKYNLAYFDRYSSENIGLVGIGFNLVLLNRYGKEAQRDTFYSNKYFKAFPLLLEEATERYRPREEEAANCYSTRIFDTLLYYLGLVTIEEMNKYKPDHTKLIRRTDLFEILFKVKHAN